MSINYFSFCFLPSFSIALNFDDKIYRQVSEMQSTAFPCITCFFYPIIYWVYFFTYTINTTFFCFLLCFTKISTCSLSILMTKRQNITNREYFVFLSTLNNTVSVRNPHTSKSHSFLLLNGCGLRVTLGMSWEFGLNSLGAVSFFRSRPPWYLVTPQRYELSPYGSMFCVLCFFLLLLLFVFCLFSLCPYSDTWLTILPTSWMRVFHS